MAAGFLRPVEVNKLMENIVALHPVLSGAVVVVVKMNVVIC